MRRRSPSSCGRTACRRAEGSLRAVPAVLLGHLELLEEQVGGQEPARPSVAARRGREDGGGFSGGYDLPSFEKLTTFKTWAEEGPPKGTLYHYPNPHNHQTLSIAASPAPPKIASQIYTQGTMTKMIVRHAQGEAMEKTIAWAETELEGFCAAESGGPARSRRRRPCLRGRRRRRFRNARRSFDRMRVREGMPMVDAATGTMAYRGEGADAPPSGTSSSANPPSPS
jgi:hypothetical protein